MMAHDENAQADGRQRQLAVSVALCARRWPGKGPLFAVGPTQAPRHERSAGIPYILFILSSN